MIYFYLLCRIDVFFLPFLFVCLFENCCLCLGMHAVEGRMTVCISIVDFISFPFSPFSFLSYFVSRVFPPVWVVYSILFHPAQRGGGHPRHKRRDNREQRNKKQEPTHLLLLLLLSEISLSLLLPSFLFLQLSRFSFFVSSPTFSIVKHIDKIR